MKPVLNQILVGALILGLAACAEVPRQFLDPRPLPTAEQIAGFGETGVAAGQQTDPSMPGAPDSKSIQEKVGTPLATGAGGAAVGAVAGLGCGPLLPLCVPVLAAAGGFAGLMVGAAATINYGSPEEVNSATITFRNALDSIAIGKRLTTFVATETLAATGRGLKYAEYEAGSEAWQSIDGREIDTLLVLNVTRFGLMQLGRSQRNPDLRLEINVAGKVYRRGRIVPMFERRWVYDSEIHGYFEWAQKQGILVTSEIDSAVKILGKQIVADYFAPEPTPPAEMDLSTPVKGNSRDGREKISVDSTSTIGGVEKQNGISKIFSKAGEFLKMIFSPAPIDPD